MPLTDASVRNAKPGEKDYKLSDGGGLQLLVKTNGSRLWNIAYRYGGKQKKLSIGPYPTVSLTEARDARQAAKKLLKQGDDPSLQKRLDKIAGKDAAANTFRKVADEFVARCEADGAAWRTIKKHKQNLKHAMRALGDQPISGITAPEIYEVLKRIEKSGRLETARAVRSLISRVFRFAIVTARAVDNPAVSLVGATRAPVVSHYGALFDPKEVGGLMRAIDGYPSVVVRAALKLTALTLLRSSELRLAEPSEVVLEGDEPVWRIPAEHAKMKMAYIVPLSRQAVVQLKKLLAEGSSKALLFPGIRSPLRPISDMTMNAALRRLGYTKEEMTGHGFRRTASTLLNEHGWNKDWIERQLAHKDKDKIRSAYNAAEFLEGRRQMMQWWADYLDRLAVDEDDLIG